MHLRELIKKEILQSSNNTISFSGRTVQFEDEGTWDITWAIEKLLKKKQIKIYDKHGNLVDKLIFRRIGSRRKGQIRRVLLNPETNEELISQTIYIKIISPRF